MFFYFVVFVLWQQKFKTAENTKYMKMTVNIQIFLMKDATESKKKTYKYMFLFMFFLLHLSHGKGNFKMQKNRKDENDRQKINSLKK